MNRYNHIAPFYDILKRIVFGIALEQAANYYITQSEEAQTILVVGGGTGQILTQFKSHHTVHYIDSSSAMIQKAKNRKVDCDVQFYHQSFEDYKASETFDAIHFPFFLDQFNNTGLTQLLNKAKKLMSPESQLVISDFRPVHELSNWRHKLLLKTVIVFFSMTTRHPISKIFNIEEVTESAHFLLVKRKYFVSGMVFASIWTKAEH